MKPELRAALTAGGLVLGVWTTAAQAQTLPPPPRGPQGAPWRSVSWAERTDAVGASGQAASPALRRRSRTRSTLLFIGGGAAGLGVHELGHVISSAAFGAHPRVTGTTGGLVPFFAIRHDPVSRRQEFVISSSGFWMQHLGSELILVRAPDLRRRSAPFEKGLLAFNLGTSAVYAAAAFARRGPDERDTRGMAVSLGSDGVAEPVIGALVLGPAVLDGYRYLRPNQAWAKWASRGLKVLGVLLTIHAG